ncbi:hypothetical protein COCOBI_03-8860 [Coccomyxa sp. Obi]|nr:hypothetical protein COCOBI_03-8860 [Coccomyxa sp. Obi]
MEIVSSLRAPLDVTNLTVVFSIMQEVPTLLSGSSSTPSGRSPGGSPFEAALDGAPPLSARLRSTPRAYSEAGDLSPRQQPMGAIMWQEVEEITCSLAANGSTVALQPGANRLAFRLHVMKQGLYVLKHAHCRLGRLALQLRAALPDEEGPPLDALTALSPALPADAQFFPGSGPPVGAVDALGNVREAAVVLHALACQPRLRLSAVAYTGALVAGHAYWLGLALEPLHDRLNRLRVHVTPAEATQFADPWAVASSSMSGASWGSRLTGSQRDGSGLAHLAQATCRLEFLDAPAELARIGTEEPEQAAPELDAQRTPLETVSRTSSTGERQESGWISVRPPGGTADLPAWAASQPSLLWLRVQAGDLPTHVQSVRVASPSEHSFGPPRQPMQPGAPMLTADISDCSEVDVNVEYLSGCQRSHAARLAIPVNPPFRLTMMAKELAEKRVMVQTQVTSMLAWQATITQAGMSAPAGYEVQQIGSEIFPLQVPPGATVQLLHSLVLKHKAGRLARSSASTLQLHFTLDAAQRALQPPRQVDCPWERPNLAPD